MVKLASPLAVNQVFQVRTLVLELMEAKKVVDVHGSDDINAQYHLIRVLNETNRLLAAIATALEDILTEQQSERIRNSYRRGPG